MSFFTNIAVYLASMPYFYHMILCKEKVKMDKIYLYN